MTPVTTSQTKPMGTSAITSTTIPSMTAPRPTTKSTTTMTPTTTTGVTTTSPASTYTQQALQNTGFEISGADDTYQLPWYFTGNANVQSNYNNAYQAYDGQYFAVLYGRSGTTCSMSQALTNFTTSANYTLQYYYNQELGSPYAICNFTVTLDGVMVDAFQSSPQRSIGYAYRTALVSALASQPSSTPILTYTLACPRFVQYTAQSNFCLDDVTLTMFEEQ
ncbi:hypothetical protein ANO11243_080320 [Dothideomycetidae sp. 11243]|nr:hypothetical protein ANO11243_080320 [fungal sp. No.11243]